MFKSLVFNKSISESSEIWPKLKRAEALKKYGLLRPDFKVKSPNCRALDSIASLMNLS